MSIGLLESGEVLCIDDSVEALVAQGPRIVGTISIDSKTGEACRCENLEPKDVIEGLRVRACTIAIGAYLGMPPQGKQLKATTKNL